MALDFGLLATGFVPKPQTTIRAEINASMQALRGPSFDMSDGSLSGQWAGVFSEREAALWDLGQALDSSQDPDKATDAALDAIATLSGTFRGDPSSSLVTETLTGIPGTIVPQGSIINTASTSDPFVTTAPATIVVLTARAISTAYVVGDRRQANGGVWQCTIAGTSSGAGTGPALPAGSPPAPGSTAVDGTVTWTFLGTGTGAIDVAVLSSVQDAIAGASFDVWKIQTPVSGWQGAANVLAATLGATEESNESLRISREDGLAGEGTGTADAIRSAILAAGATSCTVFVNNTDSTGITEDPTQPPHSVQAVVEGGDDAVIGQVLMDQVAATNATWGTTTVNVIDSQGTSHAYRFSRVVQVPIFVSVTYSYNPAPVGKGGYSTTNGSTLAKNAIVQIGNSRGIGRDVVSSSLAAALFPLFVNGFLVAGVQGILDVTAFNISIAPSPTVPTTITITPLQRATFSTVNINVVATPGSV